MSNNVFGTSPLFSSVDFTISRSNASRFGIALNVVAPDTALVRLVPCDDTNSLEAQSVTLTTVRSREDVLSAWSNVQIVPIRKSHQRITPTQVVNLENKSNGILLATSSYPDDDDYSDVSYSKSRKRTLTELEESPVKSDGEAVEQENKTPPVTPQKKTKSKPKKVVRVASQPTATVLQETQDPALDQVLLGEDRVSEAAAKHQRICHNLKSVIVNRLFTTKDFFATWCVVETSAPGGTVFIRRLSVSGETVYHKHGAALWYLNKQFHGNEDNYVGRSVRSLVTFSVPVDGLSVDPNNALDNLCHVILHAPMSCLRPTMTLEEYNNLPKKQKAKEDVFYCAE